MKQKVSIWKKLFSTSTAFVLIFLVVSISASKAFASTVNVLKYSDDNGNGSRNSGEAGLSGWDIIFDGAHKTTNGSGEVSYTEVGAGTYVLTETIQSGFNQTNITCSPVTSPSYSGGQLTFTIGADDTVNCTIGNQPDTSTITVTKFSDTDGDGVRDAGEPTLSGWDIIFDGAHQSTNGSGVTTYTGVLPGTYALSETIQSGYNQTIISCTPAPGAVYASGTLTFTVAAQSTVNCVIGNQPNTSTIAAVVYRDDNGNGTKDIGEPGLPGWSVSFDGAFQTTVADGSTLYTGVLPSLSYVLTETIQSGFNLTNISCTPPGGTFASGQYTFAVPASSTFTCFLGNQPSATSGGGSSDDDDHDSSDDPNDKHDAPRRTSSGSTSSSSTTPTAPSTTGSVLGASTTRLAATGSNEWLRVVMAVVASLSTLSFFLVRKHNEDL